jgi:hypothetical protein
MAAAQQQQDFAPHVGKRFSFPGHTVVLLLARIDVAPQPGMPDATRTSFTLIFHGPVGDILPEGLYAAQVADGPELEFYIQPIHTTARDRQEYQAVFN